MWPHTSAWCEHSFPYGGGCNIVLAWSTAMKLLVTSTCVREAWLFSRLYKLIYRHLWVRCECCPLIGISLSVFSPSCKTLYRQRKGRKKGFKIVVRACSHSRCEVEIFGFELCFWESLPYECWQDVMKPETCLICLNHQAVRSNLRFWVWEMSQKKYRVETCFHSFAAYWKKTPMCLELMFQSEWDLQPCLSPPPPPSPEPTTDLSSHPTNLPSPDSPPPQEVSALWLVTP